MVIALALCLLLCSCGKTAAERDLTKMLTHLSNGKISKAERYTLDGDLHINTSNKDAKKFYKALFSTLSFGVTQASIDGDEAVLRVAVTMVDMETLVTLASLEALGNAFSGSSGDRVRFYQLVTERIEEGQYSYMSNSVNVHLVWDQNRWKVDLERSSAFVYAITGGLSPLLGY